jgi:hypothetical protein
VATVDALGNAVFSALGSVSCTCLLTAQGQVLGDEWNPVTDSSNSWNPVSDSSNNWTVTSASDNSWTAVDTGGNNWSSVSVGNNSWQLR